MNRNRLLQNPLPIDRAAYGVVFGENDHWEPKLAESVKLGESDVQPKMRRVNTAGRNAQGWQDMTGRRFGALTALGLSCDIGKFAKWVCRCDCGIYVLRSAKSLKNPYAWADACSRCQAKKRIKGQRDKSSVQSWDKDPHNPENRREA